MTPMSPKKARGPTTECTASGAPIEERLGQTFREASRRDSPVTCVACGKRVGRRGKETKILQPSLSATRLLGSVRSGKDFCRRDPS